MSTSLLVKAPKDANVAYANHLIPIAQYCETLGPCFHFHAAKSCLSISKSFFHPGLAIMQSC